MRALVPLAAVASLLASVAHRQPFFLAGTQFAATAAKPTGMSCETQKSNSAQIFIDKFTAPTRDLEKHRAHTVVHVTSDVGIVK